MARNQTVKQVRGNEERRRRVPPLHPDTPSPGHRHRWFHFGPGIAIALLLSGFVFYTRWEDARRHQLPRIERTVAGGPAGRPGEGIAPEIATLLARREALGLSGAQVRDLERLQAEWERVSAPSRRAAEHAAREFRQWMGKTQQRQVTRIGDIQEHGAALSALSAEAARVRRTYWQSALQTLTAEQRERALAAVRTDPMPGAGK